MRRMRIITRTLTAAALLAAASCGTVPPGTVVPSSPAPTASFTFSPTSPVVSQSVFFNASTSKAAVGHGIVGFRWDFGDGTINTTSGVSASRQYALAGTYNVSLTVTDEVGAQETKIAAVTVAQGIPKASFTFTVTNATTHTVSFDGGGSAAVPPFQITTWAWVFSDGGSSPAAPSAITSHSFPAPGNYTATLTVTDSNKQTAIVSQVVSVP
jgi:PKD repeat protein